MEKEISIEQELDDLDKYLAPDEVSIAVQSLIQSKQDLQNLELFLRFNVLKVPYGSYEGLEAELLSEALTRLLEDRRGWPRGVKPKTIIANIVRSIMDERRNCADALALNRIAPSGHVDDEEEDDGPCQNAFDKHAHHEHGQESKIKNRLAEVKEAFESDETAWMLLTAKYIYGYTPERIQEELKISATEYASTLKRIKRRVAKIS